MRILFVSLIFPVLGEAMLLNQEMFACRNCLGMVDELKDRYNAKHDTLPDSFTKDLFNVYIMSKCTSGWFKRYVPVYTPELCDAYMNQWAMSFNVFFMALHSMEKDLDVCTRFEGALFAREGQWICELWMKKDDNFAACNATRACPDDGVCCPEDYCGIDCS